MRDRVEEIAAWIRKNLVTVYVWIMLTIFPVYMRDGLFDITEAKYLFVVKATIWAAGILAVMNMDTLVRMVKNGWKRSDLLFLVFLVSSVISVIGSSYQKEAFTGEAGRHLGLMLYLVYGVMLVMIVTTEHISKFVFWGYGFSALCVGGLGILNHYGIDPLHVYSEMQQEDRPFYISTIGNIDFFSIYVAVAFVFFAVLFMKGSDTKRSIAVAIPMTVSGISIASVPADTGFLAVILFWAVGWLIVDKWQEFFRFLLSAVLVLAGWRGIGILNEHMPAANWLDGMSYAVTQTWTGMYTAVGILFFAIVVYLCGKKYDSRYKENGRKIKCIGAAILGVIAWIAVVLFILVNSGKVDLSAHPLFSYLHISDEWGNLRGYVWRKTLEYLWTMPLFQKLFGIGPDTAVYIYQQILPEGAPAALTSVYDNAHNEFLQLLLTHGLLGTLAYYGWGVVSVIDIFRSGFRKKSEGCVYFAIGFTMICYFVMMLTCVNMVLVTAVPFLLLCLGKREEM